MDLRQRYGPDAGIFRHRPRQQAEHRHHQRLFPRQRQRGLVQIGREIRRADLLVEDGVLCYEYNLFIIQRAKIRAKEKLPTGKVKIEIETRMSRRVPAVR